LPLELQLCGMRVRHPFYFIDVPTPVIGGYDLIRAARLVIDADNRLVWSRRPESTTLGLVGPNPTVPVPNGSIYSGTEMTRPACGRRVGSEDLPDQVRRALAHRPQASAPGCTLRVNKSSTSPDACPPAKQRRVTAHRRRTPRPQATPVGSSDPPACNETTDVKLRYSDESEDGEASDANTAELNQCFQDHVNVIRSRPVHHMLSDTEYSDFNESEDEGPTVRDWMKLQPLFQGPAESTCPSPDDTQPDFYIMSDVEEPDDQGQGAAEASPSQSIADVLHFDSDTEYQLPDVPALTPAELEELWRHAPPCGDLQSSSTLDVMHFDTEPQQLAEPASSQLLHFTPEEVGRLWSATMQKQREALESYQSGPAPSNSVVSESSPAQSAYDPVHADPSSVAQLSTEPPQPTLEPAHVPTLALDVAHVPPTVHAPSSTSPVSSRPSSVHRPGVCTNILSEGSTAVVNNIYVPAPHAPSSTISR